MARTVTEAAQAAKIIRKELKKNGIKATVKSKNYAGGDSITVTVENLNPRALGEIKSFVNQFQAGHFNGMEDIYEYSNTNSDIPQVRHVFLNNDIEGTLRQEAWDLIRPTAAMFEDAPECFKEASGFYHTAYEVRRVVSDELSDPRSPIWTARKPRIAA